MTLQENQIELDEASCNYWHMAALIFLVFDHLLTLDTEVKCLWKRPSNISGYLFFLHRYISPLLSVFAFDLDLPMSCHLLSQLRQGVLILAQLIVVCILTLRMYVLYARNKRLLLFMISTIVVLLSIVFFGTYYHQSGHSQESDTCLTQLDTASSIRQAVAWEMLLVYDILLFVLAFHHAIKTRNELRILRNRVSLQVILLRDGAVYFGIMSLANLANILTFYLAEGCMRGGLSRAASSLSVTLVSRLMLNLHQAVDVGIYASQFTTQLDQQVETHITFARRQNVNRSATDTENLAIGLE